MSVVLNGSNQGLYVNSSLGLGANDGLDVTMSVWFKRARTGYTDTECVFTRGFDSSSTYYNNVEISTSDMARGARYYGTTDWADAGTVVSTSVWQNVIFLCPRGDGVSRTMYAYLNGGTPGTLTGTRSNAGLMNQVTIGRRNGGTNNRNFGGKIAHAAIWNALLTATEVAALQTYTPDAIEYSGGLSAANLIAYWDLLANANDSVGGFHMSNNNSPTYDENDNPSLLSESSSTFLIIPRRQLFVTRRIIQH